MSKVFCFGELLLRISPSVNGQWIREASLPVYTGGAELNVATALARWKIPVKYFTALPDNYISAAILQELGKKNIDVSAVNLSGERIGIYYLPQGTDLKNAGVIYDRSNSSFASLQPGTIDWDSLLEGCTWFHFSAITPALNENLAIICREALEAASAKGLTISVDLNYRSKLWQYGQKPTAVMPELVGYCQVIMGNIWSAEQLLGISSSIDSSEEKTKDELIAAAGASMKQVHLTYPQVTSMAYTFRLEKTYFGVLQHGAEMAVSKEFELENTVDKVGSGDCFMAGLVYGLNTESRSNTERVDFAAAAAVGKMGETGDASNQTVEQVLERVKKGKDIKKEWQKIL